LLKNRAAGLGLDRQFEQSTRTRPLGMLGRRTGAPKPPLENDFAENRPHALCSSHIDFAAPTRALPRQTAGVQRPGATTHKFCVATSAALLAYREVNSVDHEQMSMRLASQKACQATYFS
jgi:hypothetical protein